MAATRIREIPPSDISKLLSYNPGTGKLVWKARTHEWWEDGAHTAEHHANSWNAKFAGKEAFTYVMPKGHLQGRIFHKSYLAHRIVWLLHHGRWPSGQIDHINGDPSDNRISNLRDIPGPENQKNMKLSAKNTSGVSGVTYCKRARNWVATIGVKGRRVHLGSSKDFSKAVAIRMEGERKYGYHANHGRTVAQISTIPRSVGGHTGPEVL